MTIGHGVLSRITHLDRQYPDDFRLQHIRGYADEHTLTLKLDERGPAAAAHAAAVDWLD